MGLANQAVTPGRTNLLEAVNVCLAVIGEAPVNTLETQQVGEAAQAERTLLEYHKEGQTRGWGWNRERSVSFYPDATSREVLIPASVVKWAPSRLDWNNRFQARGSRVYDTEERSYAVPESIASIEADIVSLLPWDDCPEVFNRWATIRAARVFSNRAVGNTTTYQLTQSDEDQAWADLLRVDTEQSQPNAITGEEAWATFRPAMGLGRRVGGSGGWGAYGSGNLVDLGGTSSSVTLPQALGQDASPTFAGLTLSAFSTFSGQLCVLGANGAVNPLPLGSGLSIVGGALVAAGGGGGGTGTVTSVGLNVPAGFSISGSPVTTSGTLALSFAAGYGLPTTASQANWDSAYSERLRWDGSATGLAAATGRISLGLGGAAVLSVGTSPGTVAAGNDSRFATDLTYTANTRVLASSTGASATLPLFSSTAPGLASGSGGGTANFLRADGTWAAPSAGAATVTSVGLSLPSLFSVSGSPVTTAGTLAATLATQSANQVLAGPTTGGGGAPTFRALVAGDLPATAVAAGAYTYGSFTVDTTGRLTAASSGATPAITGAIGSSGLTMTTARLVGRGTAGTGALEEIQIGSNLSLSAGVLSATVTGGGGGTVTSVGLSLPGLFSVTGSPVTTAGTLAATLATQSANQVLAGPTTGVAAAPAFRALVAGDLPATTVTPGSYTYGSFTVDAAGRLTAASTGTAPVTTVTGTAPIASTGGATPAISIAAATTSAAGSMSATDKTKLDGVATGATANSSDTTLLARANHTGTQAASTVTGLKDQIGIACSDETTNLTAGTAKVTFRMPYAFTLTAVRVNCNLAPTVSAVEIDIKLGTTPATIFSTKPQIAAGSKTSVGGAVPGTLSTTALPDDGEITIDITQAGTGARGLKVWLIGTRA